MEQKVQVVRKEALADTAQTAGMTRKEAFTSEQVWTGIAHTAPGITSGWHHHGEYNSYIYLISGRARLESGPGGRDVIDGGPGDFVYVPAHTIHREGNPGPKEQVLVVFRVGEGEAVFNVDGPEGS